MVIIYYYTVSEHTIYWADMNRIHVFKGIDKKYKGVIKRDKNLRGATRDMAMLE